MTTLTVIPESVHEVRDGASTYWRRIPGLDLWQDLDEGEIATGDALAEQGVTWAVLS
jgi:hypothetical protein